MGIHKHTLSSTLARNEEYLGLISDGSLLQQNHSQDTHLQHKWLSIA